MPIKYIQLHVLRPHRLVIKNKVHSKHRGPHLYNEQTLRYAGVSHTCSDSCHSCLTNSPSPPNSPYFYYSHFTDEKTENQIYLVNTCQKIIPTYLLKVYSIKYSVISLQTTLELAQASNHQSYQCGSNAAQPALRTKVLYHEKPSVLRTKTLIQESGRCSFLKCTGTVVMF